MWPLPCSFHPVASTCGSETNQHALVRTHMQYAQCMHAHTYVNGRAKIASAATFTAENQPAAFTDLTECFKVVNQGTGDGEG